MTANRKHDQCCDQMADAIADPDLFISYHPKTRRWGIDYRDGVSISRIEYCPWCGAKLPKGLWDEWYARVEQLGLDPFEDRDRIPEELKTDRWWKEAEL
ncbi:DUF6980 family protein [Carbonactinospora thermoautotrophica]